LSRDAIEQLPPAWRALFIHAFTESLNTVFLVAALIGLVAFVFALVLPEVPLRRTIATTDVGEAFAMPTADDPLTQISRSLTTSTRPRSIKPGPPSKRAIF
jgi:hypothetical protein